MQDLYTLSRLMEVNVREKPLRGRRGLYHHDGRLITLHTRLTAAQHYVTWAHELGHAHYGDTPTLDIDQHLYQERRATQWAAVTCISEDEYAAAEGECGPHPGAIAHHLGVTREFIIAWQEAWPTMREKVRRIA